MGVRSEGQYEKTPTQVVPGRSHLPDGLVRANSNTRIGFVPSDYAFMRLLLSTEQPLV